MLGSYLPYINFPLSICVFFSPGEKFKVETKTIAVDFTLEDIYDKIRTSLAGLETGVLGLYLCHIYRFFLYLLISTVFILNVRCSTGGLTSERKIVLLIQMIIR